MATGVINAEFYTKDKGEMMKVYEIKSKRYADVPTIQKVCARTFEDALRVYKEAVIEEMAMNEFKMKGAEFTDFAEFEGDASFIKEYYVEIISIQQICDVLIEKQSGKE